MWYRLVWVWGSEILLCVGQFGVGLWEWLCTVCGTVWCGFVGVSVCCVWDCLVLIFVSECVLCVVQFGVGFG